MLLDDIRKTLEATFSNLSPSKAQELAKGLMEPGAAKDQIAKTAADLIEWSQGNRERLSHVHPRRDPDQMQTMGVATRSDLDAVKKRVRDLERAAGMTASGRAGAKKARPGSAPPRRSAPRGSPRRRSARPRARPRAGEHAPGRSGVDGRRHNGRDLDGRVARHRRGIRHRDQAPARHRTRPARLGRESTPRPRRRSATGLVLVSGSPATKVATMVGDDAAGRRSAALARRFVSRGGEKLDAALDRFEIDPAGLRVRSTPAHRPAGSPIACSRAAPRA